MNLFERDHHIQCHCGNVIQRKTIECPECGYKMKDLLEDLLHNITPEDLQ